MLTLERQIGNGLLCKKPERERGAPLIDQALPDGRASDGQSIEFAFWFFLIRADAARVDFCARVIFPLHRLAGDPAEHRDLADVREGVGNWALEHSLARSG